LLSIEEYQALARQDTIELAALWAEFDAMFERMQTPEFRKAMDTASGMSPAEMGKAAVAAARKRG
jgi:hypothetical protein